MFFLTKLSSQKDSEKLNSVQHMDSPVGHLVRSIKFVPGIQLDSTSTNKRSIHRISEIQILVLKGHGNTSTEWTVPGSAAGLALN